MSLANDTPLFDTQMIRMPPFPGLSFIVSKLSIVLLLRSHCLVSVGNLQPWTA